MAVVIDRFSRKAIGWALDRTLAARIAVTALKQAIERRQPPPGVVLTSDQGIQFACADFHRIVKANGMIPSMSRPANPYDNAACESFMKTLKQEEIYCNQYRDFDDLSAHLEEFIENYYNRLRLHSALGYRTPEEFEQDTAAAASGSIPAAATMKYLHPKGHGEIGKTNEPAIHLVKDRNGTGRPVAFLRHDGIYRSDVVEVNNKSRGGAGRLPLVGPRAQVKERDGRNTPFSSSAMSSGRLFLDRVARQQSPSPLHRHRQNKTMDGSEETNYHRTVTASFPSCLTNGVHPIYPCLSAFICGQ